MGFKQRFYRLVGSSFVALTMMASSALAEELDNWSFDTATNELTFSLSDTVLPEFFLLAEPPRLVLDIPNTQIGAVEPEQVYSGAVQTIRVAQHAPDQVRVVIELAPDTVLSPDQADIQFDDNNGQRYWRFRPLLADSTTIADSPTPGEPAAAADASLSAANLELSAPSAEAVLPIDPYASGSSEQQVSVPPLEAISESADVAADMTDVGSESEPAAAALDLPPMTVPELEVTEVDGAFPTAAAAPTNVREAVLPDLAARDAARDTDVESTVEAALTEDPEDVSPAAVPEVEAAQTGEDSGEAAIAAIATTTPDEVIPLPDDAMSTVEPTSAAADESPVEVMPTETAETALAPVKQPVPEATPDQTAAVENPPTQPIQQPAADRTIVQTDIPAPLTFGQPLPSQSR